MRYFLLLFLPIFPIILAATPFKVATYNVENLFDAQVNGSEYKEYTPGKHNWNARMVEIKLNHISEVICDLDADILALQEIENKTVFKALQKRLSRVGCAYPYAAISSKKGAPIQVALLSRFPMTQQKELQVSYSPHVRNILEVDLNVRGEALKVFVNHWKSKAYKGFESKRIKYAKTLKRRLKKLPKSTDYILLGDFNTNYDDYVHIESKLNDTEGRTGLHHILGGVKEGELLTETQMIQQSLGYYYTLWNELPIDKRWNTKYYANKGTSDHILLPSSMFDKKGLAYVNDSFRVFKEAYLFTKRGYINRWQYKKSKHRGKGYSDHLPIYAYFDTKPYKENKTTSQKKRKQEVKDIEYLYSKESLENEVILKNVVVIWKHRQHAVIKQSKKGRGVFLFSCASRLEVGKTYDILVKAIKTYKGLKEVTHLYKIEEKEKVDTTSYVLSQADVSKEIFRQNEIVHNLVGVYKNKHFYVEGRKMPIYFKKRKRTPKNGTKIKIHYAHVGYYKKLQLVVYSKKDFTIVE